MSLKGTRRDFIKYASLLGAGIAIAGCAPKAQPAPTAAPAQAATQPAAEQKPAAAEKVELRYMERDGMLGDFMRYASRLYEERNPNITVKNEPAGWTDLTQKVPTMVAAGTMDDLAFQHGAYMLPTLGRKGAWLDMTPAAERDNHDFSIYYQWALDTCKQGPKDELVAMPMGVHFGQNEMHWNVEMVDSMGLDQPNDQMTHADLLEFLVKVQEKMPEGGFATDMGPKSHFNTEWLARCFGGYVIGPERKQCGMMMAETRDAYQWAYDMVNKYKVIPGQTQIQDSTQSMFYAGMLATYFNCSANVWVGFQQAVGDKFTLGHCVWPHGGGEPWGTMPSADATVIYGKTKYPDESWGLAKLLSSEEVSIWTAVSEAHMTPGAVISAWHDRVVWEACPPYKNCALGWDTLTPDQYGNIGLPYNTRRAEFDDKHDNDWGAMLYGDAEYNEGNMQKLADALQAIMDKDLP